MVLSSPCITSAPSVVVWGRLESGRIKLRWRKLIWSPGWSQVLLQFRVCLANHESMLLWGVRLWSNFIVTVFVEECWMSIARWQLWEDGQWPAGVADFGWWASKAPAPPGLCVCTRGKVTVPVTDQIWAGVIQKSILEAGVLSAASCKMSWSILINRQNGQCWGETSFLVL